MTKKKTEIPKEGPEKMVSFFDPVAEAFREIPLSVIKKYLAEVENLKKQVEKDEEN